MGVGQGNDYEEQLSSSSDEADGHCNLQAYIKKTTTSRTKFWRRKIDAAGV